MSSSRDEMIGGVLSGRYQLVSHIEEGRFGDFWKAKDQKTDGTVAVKLLKPEMFSDPEAFKRFEREAQLLSEFRHPNLLRVRIMAARPPMSPGSSPSTSRGGFSPRISASSPCQ